MCPCDCGCGWRGYNIITLCVYVSVVTYSKCLDHAHIPQGDVVVVALHVGEGSLVVGLQVLDVVVFALLRHGDLDAALCVDALAQHGHLLRCPRLDLLRLLGEVLPDVGQLRARESVFMKILLISSGLVSNMLENNHRLHK